MGLLDPPHSTRMTTKIAVHGGLIVQLLTEARKRKQPKQGTLP